MKKLLLIILIVTAICQESRYQVFRIKEGKVAIGKKHSNNVRGTIFRMKTTVAQGLFYYGMDMNTMTPFGIRTEHPSIPTNDFEEVYYCERGLWARDVAESFSSGTTKYRVTSNKIEVIGNCLDYKNVSWIFNSTIVKSNTYYYPPKEAGYRAKYLIGQSIDKFSASDVIQYAIMDYLFETFDCDFYLTENFEDAPGPAPGVIIVGKDKEHCGIIDNEGDKFIHTNPIKNKVTLDSIVQIKRYFPKGHVYKIPRKNAPREFIGKSFK